MVKRPVLRNILMYGLHTTLRIIGVGYIRDTQCRFKPFSRRAALDFETEVACHRETELGLDYLQFTFDHFLDAWRVVCLVTRDAEYTNSVASF
ncbi:hypothetical protein BDR04DRAFT_1212987 [Suillus decipiens]|nr:hypothetical protein BDR04DRAFT_1212987 [Suillus decipiens]